MTTATKSREDVRVDEHEFIQQVIRDYDGINYKVEARVDKFDRSVFDAVRAELGLPDDVEPTGRQLLKHATPYETVRVPGNLLTRLGRKRLIDRLGGTASNQAMDATHTRIGVGNDATAAADTQTDLVAAAGSGNRQFQLCDSIAIGTGASSGVFTVIATFTTGVGNFAWAEWCLDGGTANGTTVTSDANTTPGMFNRKVTSLGTKTSAASWVFTITITIT